MTIRIITVGKKSSSEYSSLIQSYEKRMASFAKIEWLYISNADITNEAKQILQKIIPDSFVILLDENGVQPSNQDLAEILKTRKSISIIIGGAYGVEDIVRQQADYVLSISKLVFPHQLVRLIVAEQLYRSMTLIQNHPYHHK